MLLIGHRGCFYPGYNKNTIRAFEKVTNEGVLAIEFDIQLSGDNELVVVHNLDLEEVSTGTGLVSETTLTELKQLFAGDPERGEDRIPSLVEALDFFASRSKRNRPVAHAELKGHGSGIPTGILLKSYFETDRLQQDDVLISSFNWQELKDIRTVLPDIRIALLDGAIHRSKLLAKLPTAGEQYFRDVFAYGDEDYILPRHSSLEANIPILEQHCPDKQIRTILYEEIKDCLAGAYYTNELLDEAQAMRASSVNLWYSTVSEEFIKKAQERGFKVYVYTANKEEEWRHLKHIDVDGIFTDYFAQARDVIEE